MFNITKNKKKIIYYHGSENCDIDSVTGEIGQYILAAPTCDSKLYHLIVDGEFMFSTDALPGALLDILCYHYVLDISYPKSMYALLIFIQHFIFGITDSGNVPTSVINLCSKLQ